MIREDKHWKLDRRIPIAVITALLMQIFAAVIWVTELDARVNNIESQSIGTAAVNERFARLEERLESLKESLFVVRHQLDQLIDRSNKR